MNRLTTLDVRCLLADLDLAIKYRHDPDLIEECVTRAKDCLLRAALADVEVEPVRGSSLLDAFHPRELAHARASG